MAWASDGALRRKFGKSRPAQNRPGMALVAAASISMIFALSGCKGDKGDTGSDGPAGPTGPAGQSCTLSDTATGKTVTCPDGTTITLLTSPTTNIKGLGVDPANPDRVRIATDTGVVMESTTGGVGRFQTIGVEPFPGNGLVYQVSFDPRNLDHVVAGAATEGAKWSLDGGRTWTAATVRTTTQTADRGANIFSLKISPVSSDVVWIEGIDLGENLANLPSEGRHIWRSVDGGRTFQAVIEKNAAVSLTNGILMAPHPRDSNLLYFEFGTYFGGYGTDIFRYDGTSRTLTVNHNNYDDVGSIAFMPGDPAVMFFGLVNEDIR
jgi:hypothetical protein